jgi:hypothetical protein
MLPILELHGQLALTNQEHVSSVGTKKRALTNQEHVSSFETKKAGTEEQV